MRCFNISLVLLSILLFVWSRPSAADPGDLLQTVVNPAPGENARFGVSVALGDGQILVGVPQDHTGATEAGVVYLFGTDGALLQTYQNPTPDAFDRFGTSVALGEGYVLVGAIKDDAGGYLSGTAYLFDTAGNLLQTLQKPIPDADLFGYSVALTADHVLVGAAADNTGATQAGAAYLFDMDGNLLHTYLNPTPGMGDQFGWSVALAGDQVLASAISDDTGAVNAGAAYLFDTAGTLLQTFLNPAPIPGVTDQFGYAVGLFDGQILVGAPKDDTGAIDAGAVHLFEGVDPAVTFTVDSMLDTGDSNPGDGICDDGGGNCTLRAALEEANALAGADYIHFNIPGGGPHTFVPNSPLPTITDPVTIDGTTEPDFAGAPLIELDGSSAGTGATGLTITAGNSAVIGLAINRFTSFGILLQTNGGNILEGCFIGTDVTGTINLGNASNGVRISNVSNCTIGGATAGARNIISGNNCGIFMIGSSATGNVVEGNYIGTDITGTVGLGNNAYGVAISSAPNNRIGRVADGAGNTIAHNGGDGVFVDSGTGNAVSANSIHSNTGLGIDLGANGVNGNDAGDGDSGANELQNFPVLTGAFSGSNIISGSLNSTPGIAFRLEFFAADIRDATGFGEGRFFLGAVDVISDGSGDADFSASVPNSFVLGQWITATATDPNGNTSEFAQCIEATEPTLSVSLPHATSPYDQNIQIPVQITDTSGGGIVSAEIFVSYDGDLLTAFSTPATGTLLTDDWSVETNIVEGNGTDIDTVKIAMATGEDPLAGAGTLIHVNFTVGDIRSPASSPLTLEHVLFNDGTPLNTTSDGSVTLVGIDGMIANDPTQIIPRQDIAVTVTDADEDRDSGAQDSFTVQVDNGAQSETLTVLETTVNSGIFEATISTVFSLGATSGDNVVQAQAGDLIQSCYDDSLDVDGNAIERCADTNVIGGTDGAIRVTIVSQPGDTVRVRVTDADLNTNPGTQETTTVEATNPTSGEAETITLTEQDADNAIFFGIVETAISSGSTSDGILATQKGEEVVVTYADTLLANGGTADLPDTDYVIDPFGDADGNGSVQAFDAAKVLLHCLVPYLTGLDSLSANLDLLAFHPEAPGANPPPPGQVTPYDASLILQKRVGLIGRFEVQEDEADNHPQPETDQSTPKGLADERVVVLQMGDGYVSVWMEDRSSIVSGEIAVEGISGQVEMGEGWSDFLSASRPVEDGLWVVFAGASAVDGPGELLRVFGVGPEDARLIRARFNDGGIIGRMSEVEEAGVIPLRFALHPNQPNPFNPETTIRFELPKESPARLEVFDMLGQRVVTLVAGTRPRGVHEAVWDGRDETGVPVSSGLYLYRLQAGDWRSDASRPAYLWFEQVRRMLLLK